MQIVQGSPNLQFNFTVINPDTYLLANGKHLQIPINTIVTFNSPFYLKDQNVYGYQISFTPTLSVSSNGLIQYEISSQGMQTYAQSKVSWYWQEPWGVVTFSFSFLQTLTDSGYFNVSTTHYHSNTYLNFNWINALNNNNLLFITSNNTPAIPNFLAEVTAGNVQIVTNLNPVASTPANLIVLLIAFWL